MNVACPNCRVDIAVPEEVLRRGVARVTCKKCSFAFVIRLGDPGAAKPPPAAPPPKLEGVKSSGSLVSTAGEISKQPQRFIAADTRTSIVLDPELQREIDAAREPRPPAEEDTSPVTLPPGEDTGLAALPTEVGGEPTPAPPAVGETRGAPLASEPEGFESFRPPEAPVVPPAGAEAPIAPPPQSAPPPPPMVPQAPTPIAAIPGMPAGTVQGGMMQPGVMASPGVAAGVPAGMAPPGMAPPGMVPPGMVPPGMVPPGMVPPGMVPPGMVPPGMVPGMMVPGMMAPGMPPSGGTLPPEPPEHGGNVYAHRPAYAVYTHPSGVPIEVVIGIDDLSPPRPGGATKALGVFMLLVFLVGGPFLLFVLYRNDWSLDLANLGTMVARAFGSQPAKPPASKELRGLELTPVEPILAEATLASGERALTVQGVVKNNDTRTRRFIYVRAWLRDARGQKVLSGEAPAGNIFSKEQLAGLDRTSLQSHLNPGGSDGRNQRVEPGQTVAYMVVLTGLPQGFALAEHTVTAEVSQAELYQE